VSRREAFSLLPRLLEALPGVAGGRMLDLDGRPLATAGEQELRLPLPAGPTGALTLVVPSGSFFQGNLEGNAGLIESVLEFANTTDGLRVLELYSGAGNFSLPLAAAGATVLALEGDPSSVDCCRNNAKVTGLSELTAERADLGRGLPTGLLSRFAPELVLLDPPRGGAAAALRDVAESAVSRLIYVSCDPPALARDGRMLAERGFAMKRWRALDLFPQTFHVETVALFER
jgi:23S rRNA (uracil1939-C5)-methyltransferase